jgi:hypothetical protein
MAPHRPTPGEPADGLRSLRNKLARGRKFQPSPRAELSAAHIAGYEDRQALAGCGDLRPLGGNPNISRRNTIRVGSIIQYEIGLRHHRAKKDVRTWHAAGRRV